MAKREAYGDHRDKTGPFHWGAIELNLPGTRDYDPTLPWVMKVRYDGHLACEVYVYVDDGKVTGWCRAACWAAASRFSKVMARLGIQEASRKRTEPSTTPGPWAGSVSHTQSGVELLVSLAKWEKARLLVEELSEMTREAKVDRKRLERIRGYLIYTPGEKTGMRKGTGVSGLGSPERKGTGPGGGWRRDGSSQTKIHKAQVTEFQTWSARPPG
ncbi:hypothetical protein ACHAW6_015846 [Cyclotella cf. meneghiniana]